MMKLHITPVARNTAIDWLDIRSLISNKGFISPHTWRALIPKLRERTAIRDKCLENRELRVPPARVNSAISLSPGIISVSWPFHVRFLYPFWDLVYGVDRLFKARKYKVFSLVPLSLHPPKFVYAEAGNIFISSSCSPSSKATFVRKSICLLDFARSISLALIPADWVGYSRWQDYLVSIILMSPSEKRWEIILPEMPLMWNCHNFSISSLSTTV